ncbi:DUF6538 domain-containing protein [Methylobacterium currus]|uniref:DUF6538 domain-containing protein n=1 Tax=Methylobacterium currus TaxID=2051553 RepID=UPI003B8382E2
MRRAEYLQCRRGRWFVRLRVPVHLQTLIGQSHFVRSLDTDSEAVAQERRRVALALLWEWIGAQTVSDGWEPAWAAALTGSQRCDHDGAEGCPRGPDAPAADRSNLKLSQPRPTSAQRLQQHTILSMMERWLREIEGVMHLEACRRGALRPRAQ